MNQALAVSTVDILLLNGPNLNLLGSREPHIYGSDSLSTIEQRLIHMASAAQLNMVCFQSNSEGTLIDRIHLSRQEQVRYILINPGGLTHTSVALRDALVGVSIPFIEIHLSNIHAREPFRHHSFLSDKAAGVVVGFGAFGYEMALMSCIRQLSQPPL